jgi:hypothetical protein
MRAARFLLELMGSSLEAMNNAAILLGIGDSFIGEAP